MARPSVGAQPEPPAEPLTFERAFKELQEVIGRLEDGGLGLEASVELFERGIELAAYCERIVDAAELRVTRLVPQDDEEDAF